MRKANPFPILLALMLAMSLVSCSNSVPVPTSDIEPIAACPQPDPHPIGESISEKFEVPYAEVMDWFCGGETFEDILLALETQDLSGRSVEELFIMKEQMSWEDIWKELGIVP
jgi:hypothetical protein